MNALERTGFFQIRVTDEERAMLRALADERGLSAADVVRTFIRDAYRERFGDKRPPKPKK
jgi:hypothetical protein